MRTLQILPFGVFAVLLVACGAWVLAWFGTSSGPLNEIQAAAEPKSPKSTVGRISILCRQWTTAVWEGQNLGRSRRARMGLPLPVWQGRQSGLWRSRASGQVPQDLSGESGA